MNRQPVGYPDPESLCVCGHPRGSHYFNVDDEFDDGHCIRCEDEHAAGLRDRPCPPFGFRYAGKTEIDDRKTGKP